MERSKADSFTAFLKEKQRLKSMRQPQQQGATPLSILNVLADAPRQQMPVQDLQAASGMSFTGFAEALKALQESGYLALSGPPGGESAVLTPLGVDVAGLARPRYGVRARGAGGGVGDRRADRPDPDATRADG